MKLSKTVQREMSIYVWGIIQGIQYSNKDSEGLLDDMWLTWSDRYDINIFFDADDTLQASAYQVKDNKTDCSEWVCLDLEAIKKPAI